MLHETWGTDQPAQPGPPEGDADPQRTARRWPTWAWLSGILLLALLLLTGIVTLGWTAYRDGLAVKAERERAAALLHVSRADALAKVGERALAEQELVEALRLAPGYPAAQERLSELRVQPSATPVPPPTATPTAAPTGTPLVTATPSPSEVLTAAEKAAAARDWPQAISTLEALRSQAPYYEPATVEGLLTQAYIEDGMREVSLDHMSAAIERFKAALTVSPENMSAAEQLALAQAYVEAVRTWNQDPATTITKLDELYQRVPGYKDVAARLAQAYVLRGDGLVDERRACQAEADYSRALAVSDQPDTQAKLIHARQACLGIVPAARYLTGTIMDIRDVPAQSAQIVGQVFDRRRVPLSGIVVTVQGAEGWTQRATTNSAGEFAFYTLPVSNVYSVDVPAAIGPAVPVRLQTGKQAIIVYVEP